MAKTILVASGKGGAGKSTVSSLLGQALASLGHKTLILELDSGLRSLDVSLGVSKSLIFDLGDIIRGSCETEAAVSPCPFCGGLSVICAAAKPVIAETETLEKIKTELGESFDFIILDCPAGIGEQPEKAAPAAELGLVVSTPDPSSIRAAGNLSALLRENRLNDLRLIIERCPQKAKKLAPVASLDEVINGAAARLLGVVWEDPFTRSSVDSGTALSYGSPNKKAFDNIARRILGERVPLGFK